MSSCTKPPMPCFSHPNPTSASPTPFVYERRHFTVKTLPDNFPYEVIRDNGLQIHYFEFRGQGPPPADVGHAGDVWMNVVPGELALYARLHTEWVLWPGPRKAKKQMFEHPLVGGRYLWCTRKHVLWYTCDGIRKSASLQTRGEEEDFGRQRYRTVGPMERGGARKVSDGAPRVPLRTAAEAIAKILELEEDERRQGRDVPEPKRRRIKESEGPSDDGSVSASASVSVAVSPAAAIASADGRSPPAMFSKYPATPARRYDASGYYSAIQPPHGSPSSSLSQALGPHSEGLSKPSAPVVVTPSTTRPLPGPSFLSQFHSSTASSASPSTSSAGLPPRPSINTTARADADLSRLRDENSRLSDENRRLSDENSRLAVENQRLRSTQQPHPTTPYPPELINIVRDTLNTSLGSRVHGLLADAQEQRAARVDAERKLAEFQEQLKKMTQAFQLPGMVTRGDSALNTPGPSPRLATSDS
ncbi:hypothetical protein BV25DRAFT_1993656 [Artomyces pyxidatus]|uniref:Uncharacterized protein n=1 Tax=Artomyces pyxidatus TaxID=48021 RepID=A0ACB8SRX1_9AGAM|nr:hypothetical protein BV25DRAFT_1993656 [Artomyces pyxidatus]